MLDAIWVSGGGDRRVRVLRLLGRGPDGRDYVRVAGTATGIPLDELYFKDPAGWYRRDLPLYADESGKLRLSE